MSRSLADQLRAKGFVDPYAQKNREWEEKKNKEKKGDARFTYVLDTVKRNTKMLGGGYRLPHCRHGGIEAWIKWYAQDKLPDDIGHRCYFCGEKKVTLVEAGVKLLNITPRLGTAPTEMIIDTMKELAADVRPRVLIPIDFDFHLKMYLPEAIEFFKNSPQAVCNACREWTINTILRTGMSP